MCVCVGLGNPFDVDSGMMNTWHFSMFSSIFNRLKRSSRRTMNPDEAKLFFIPYDMGLDGNVTVQCRVYSYYCDLYWLHFA